MHSRETELKFIFLLFDLVVLNLAIILVAWLKLYFTLQNNHEINLYLLHGNLSWIITYFIFTKKNLYLRDGFFNRVKRISKRTLVFLVVLAVLAFLFMPRHYSRTFLLEYTILFYVGKLIFYWLLYTFLKYKRRNGLNTNRVLIVGINDTSHFLSQIIESNPILGYQFIGFVSSKSSTYHNTCLGTPDQLPALIKKHQIQMVFVLLSIFSEENRAKEYLRICDQMGIRLRFVPENQRWFRSHINMESVGGLVLINPQEIPLDDFGARIWKRLFDLSFSIVCILFFSWLFPIIALVIKLSSKGPVFFVQKRTGINNKTFSCIKFRSMQVNGEANIKQASPTDCRITWIGRFLRKTNLDELPQFFNVLWGQMSVVGPRPHMLKHTKQYSKLIEHYLVRHYVKPGITGWAQVNGLRGETDELWKMEKRVEYDMEYIENWTFWWDISIIFQTLIGIKSYKNAR